VNTRDFLENFHYVAQAPNGIKRLRELVYFLGITGSLCPQDPAEGDGGGSLQSIAKERSILLAEGRFKSSPRLENLPYAFGEGLPPIPASWVWTRLVDVGEISPRVVEEDQRLGTFASMSAISEMHGVPIQGVDRIWKTMKKGYTHFADGDVIVAKITPCFENGKAAVVNGLTNGFGAGTTELHVVRPLAGIEPRFVYAFLRSSYFRSSGVAHMTGTSGQKRLPTGFFATCPFPLPPLREQQRIVAKVDELMALCATLEAQQHECEQRGPVLSKACHARFSEALGYDSLDAIFDGPGGSSAADLRANLVSLAVQGRLVPQDPNEHLPAELIDSTLHQEAGRPRLPVIREDDVPFAVPHSWTWERLGNIALASDSGWSPKCEPFSRLGTSWGVLKVSAVSRGKFLPEENKALPSHVEARPEYEVKDGDFLLVRANTAQFVASSVVVRNPPARLMMSDKIVRFHVPTYLDKQFLNLVNSSRWARDYYTRNASGTSSSMKNVSRSLVEHLPIPIPPSAEQHRIVKRLDELMDFVDRLESQQREKERISDAFAKAAVAAITGTPVQDLKPMTPPKTELVTRLLADRTPGVGARAPLAALLVEHQSGLSAKSLWQRSGLAIEVFYQQLKTEMAQGWIVEPEPAAMREVAVD